MKRVRHVYAYQNNELNGTEFPIVIASASQPGLSEKLCLAFGNVLYDVSEIRRAKTPLLARTAISAAQRCVVPIGVGELDTVWGCSISWRRSLIGSKQNASTAHEILLYMK